MENDFGRLIQDRRRELRLTLRDFAARAGMDPGNVSKIERGRLAPPQDEGILTRICLALEYEPGDPAAQQLRDVAASQNGRIPADILSNDEVMAQMPILLRTVNNRQLSAEQVERLIEMIRDA
ncbi:MAG: helix-turn-helix domain-containing protein [Gemmatimonadetes bacterium]|nr:helix-turn-helix domain-containing protein [Gemmatimonadota bacterium]